jgi:hypothetical protein
VLVHVETDDDGFGAFVAVLPLEVVGSMVIVEEVSRIEYDIH